MKQVLDKQTATLENIDKTLKNDKLIQLSQAALQAKTDRDLNEDQKDLSARLEKLTEIAEKGLVQKTGDGLNSNVTKMAKSVKDLAKSLEKREKEVAGINASDISEKAKGIKTYKGVKDVVKEKVDSVKDFFTMRGFLDKTGIAKRGGSGLLSQIADKSEAKQKFIQQLSVTQNTFEKGSAEEKIRAAAAGKQFDQSHSLLKENKANEAKIAEMKESGWSDDQIAKTGLLDTREDLTGKIKKVDKRFKDVGNLSVDSETKQSKTKKAKETAAVEKVVSKKQAAEKTVEREKKSITNKEIQNNKIEKSKEKVLQMVDSKKESAINKEALDFSDEGQLEAQRAQEHTIDLLSKIEENTRPVTGGGTPEAPKETKGGGFLDGIMSFLGEGLMTAVKGLFNPRNLLKTFTKFLGPAVIIGALANGIIDGFKALMSGGSFTDVIVSFWGGVLDFLTFGLFGKEQLQKIVNAVSGFVDEFFIQPIKTFFNNIKEALFGFLKNIEIPRIGFKIPFTDKEVGVGPFKPFGESQSSSSSSPSAPAPQTANAVTAKSAENAEVAGTQQKPAAPVIVNAPTNVANSSQNIAMPAPTRNEDRSLFNYASRSRVMV